MSPVRNTAFPFTSKVTPQQDEFLRRHVGASRYAYNQALRLSIDAQAVWRAFRERDTEAEYAALPREAIPHVPRSGFDFVNAFDRYKRSSAAGPSERPGLPWRSEVCQQIFEASCVDGQVRHVVTRKPRETVHAREGSPRWPRRPMATCPRVLDLGLRAVSRGEGSTPRHRPR